MEYFWGTLEGSIEGRCPEEVIPGIIHFYHTMSQHRSMKMTVQVVSAAGIQ
jgi:hypothetical protein